MNSKQKQAKRKILGEIMIDKAEHLHTQNMLDELNEIIKRFFSEYYALSHEYTIEEIPAIVRKKTKRMGDAFYDSVAEFSQDITQTRYGGGAVSKEQLQSLIGRFEKIVGKLTAANLPHLAKEAEKKEEERQKAKAEQREQDIKHYEMKLSVPIKPEWTKKPETIQPEITIEKKLELRAEPMAPSKPVLKSIKEIFVEEQHDEVIKLKRQSKAIEQLISKIEKIKI